MAKVRVTAKDDGNGSVITTREEGGARVTANTPKVYGGRFDRGGRAAAEKRGVIDRPT